MFLKKYISVRTATLINSTWTLCAASNNNHTNNAACANVANANQVF